MANSDSDNPGSGSNRLIAIIGALPTGAKLFLILSAALLPLAMVAVYAALQTNRLADQETQSRLRVATTEASRALAIELTGDMNALRVALAALDGSPDDLASCARARGVFAEQLSAGAHFAIVDRGGRLRCGTASPPRGQPAIKVQADQPTATQLDEAGLVLTLASPSGELRAAAQFPRRFLAPIARPTGFTQPFASNLVGAPGRIALDTIAGLGPLDRVEAMRAPLGIAGLELEMSVRSAPLTSTLILAMLLPMLMWAAATGIAWFVVDRLLIRPLRDLRRTVAAYQPGREIDPGIAKAMPAREIRDLGETFQAFSRTLVVHEAGLAEGLVRQTRLTREVHHRVKNNLQVISSLISLHARGARSREAAAAYAAIQRRVDALAVVHRNHFAELEDNPGLSLRSVIGDLTSNIRATAPEEMTGAIMLDLDSSYASQDVATAVSFLLTELIELAVTVDPTAAIRVLLYRDSTAATCGVLQVDSAALVDSPSLQAALAERFGRVLEGLSRQLRSRLEHDGDSGCYRINITIIDRD